MLKTRILTAIVALPILVAAIVWSKPLCFAMILTVLILCAAWEWSAFIGFSRVYLRIIYVLCIAAGLFLSAFVPVFYVSSIAVLIWLWALVAIVHYQHDGVGAGFQFPIARLFIGCIVLVSTWISILTLQTVGDFGPQWLLLVLGIIFAADAGGYFVGRVFGKQALCSRVSPKKTWEGFAGGLIFSLIVATIGGLFLSLPREQYFWLLFLTLITALFSVVGDLCVSLLKRMSGVKDSGIIFPGHGGILDRLDSVASATVIFVFGAQLLGF